MSLIGKAVRLLNQSKAPIPLGDGASAARRGLSYNLGSGRADAETHMRQYGMSGTIYGIVSLLAESTATPHWRLYKKPPKDGRVRYTTGDQGSDQRTEVVQHAAIQLLNNPNDWHCLAPETRVITEDLRWVPVGELQVGDRILGFDEESPGGRGQRRSWRENSVIATGRKMLPSSLVTLADGTQIVAADDHPWLTSMRFKGSYWRKTSDLMCSRPGWNIAPAKVAKLLDVWDPPATYEAGYLAGMYDGEGHLSAYRSQNGFTLGIAQRDNEALFEVRSALDRLGFHFKESTMPPSSVAGYESRPCHSLALIGGGAAAGRRPAQPEILRLLGSVRPKRLLAKWLEHGPGQLGRIQRLANVPVVSVEPLGLREVVTLATATKTYVAEGFAMHNSRFEFFEGCQQHEELTGETFWVLDNEAGFPTSMWYVRPDRMQPVPDNDQYLLGWIYTSPTGEQVPLRTTEVILEKRPDPLDPYRGAGPVASILPNIQQQRYATEYQRNLFLNGADPGGVIQVPTTLSEPQFDDLVDRWRESHRGVARAGMVGVLENGATWIPNAHSNKDMEYGQLRLANRDELREAWRIHKAMMGSSDDVNRANAQTAQEVFVAWQVIPRLNRRRDTLNSKLLPLFKDKSVEFDYDDPFPPNAENASKELLDKAQAWAALVDGGADPHDALEVVGLPDMDMAEVATQAPALPPSWVSTEQAAPPAARERIAIRAAQQPAPPAQPQRPTQQQAEKIDLQWKAAVALLVAAWTAHVLPGWYASLLAQIRTAISNGDPDALTTLTVPDAGIDEGAAAILAHTRPFAAAAAQQAADEAAHQGARGVTAVTPGEDALTAAARASAQLQAQQAALSAGREAFRVAGPDADPDDVADHVEQFLNGLSDAGPTAAASQVMSAAQNHARLATIAAGPRSQVVAVELHDGNTCDPCDDINGHVFGYSDDPDAVAEAAAAYPAGGYALCEGGPRCRGTVYGVYGGASNRYGGGVYAARDAATKVFTQVAEDFPPQATAWMHHADWTGPVNVPLSHVDWTPSGMEMEGKDPDRIAAFAKKLRAGKKLKPVILVKTPGVDKLQLVDGHHRFLASAETNKPVRAFIGIVDADHGPWETMHDMQYAGHQNRGRLAIGAAATLSKEQVHYRDAAETGRRCGTCSMFRGPNACTLVKGVINADDVCDRWAARAESGNKLSPAEAVDLARRIQSDGWTPVQIGGRS